MTRVDESRLSPVHQRFIKNRAKLSEQWKKPRAKKVKPTAFGEEFRSQLECDFAHELEVRRLCGEIDEWRYEPLRFRIAHNVSYTPDFMTVEPIPESYAGERLTFYEVKGSWLAKNARDSRTRLQVAAYMFQMFAWMAVTRVEQKWTIETIHAKDAEEAPMD